MIETKTKTFKCSKNDNIRITDFLYIDKDGVVHSVTIDDYGIWKRRKRKRMVSFMDKTKQDGDME